MSIDLATFEPLYARWVEESLADYQAGKVEKVIKKYPFIQPGGVPWVPFKGTLSNQTVALVTTGGLYLKDGQSPFETESIHGDPSHREIPSTVRQGEFGIAHAHYDHAMAAEDFNTVFPIHRLAELESNGVIGKTAETHFSFSYVNDVVTLVKKTIPAVVDRLKSLKVDVLLLAPV